MARTRPRTARSPKPTSSRAKAVARATAPARSVKAVAAAAPVRPPVRPQDPPAPPPAPARKPGFYEAIALYENGVRALQRHDYTGAADLFRGIIERYPDERELLERSRLYLRVCERETARRPAVAQTPQERVYAATVALNSGDHTTALDHLQQALNDAPDSDHAHYIMAVALAGRGQSSQALDHLRQAIDLNPENRALARQDPDLEALRDAAGFKELTDAAAGPNRARRRR